MSLGWWHLIDQYGEGVARWFYFTQMEESGLQSTRFITIMTAFLCVLVASNLVRCVWAFGWLNQDVLYTSSGSLTIFGWVETNLSESSGRRSYRINTLSYFDWGWTQFWRKLWCKASKGTNRSDFPFLSYFMALEISNLSAEVKPSQPSLHLSSELSGPILDTWPWSGQINIDQRDIWIHQTLKSQCTSFQYQL